MWLDEFLGLPRFQVDGAEIDVETRRAILNLIQGGGVSISASEDIANERINLIFGVDGSAAMLPSVRLVETGNVGSLAAAPATVDGVNTAEGDDVALAGQSNSEENGIYTITGGALVRRADLDASAEFSDGALFGVREGDDFANSIWQIGFTPPMDLGTTTIGVFQINAASLITPPADPADDGAIAVANGGDLTYVSDLTVPGMFGYGGAAGPRVQTYEGQALALADSASADPILVDTTTLFSADHSITFVVVVQSWGATAADWGFQSFEAYVGCDGGAVSLADTTETLREKGGLLAVGSGVVVAISISGGAFRVRVTNSTGDPIDVQVTAQAIGSLW